MARGTTLIKLLDDLRVETRASTNPAHNNQVRDSQVRLLQRTQDWLWGDHDWPHLFVSRKYPLEAGKRYYDFTHDFDIERISYIEVKTDGAWRKLVKGIGPQQFVAYDSDLDQRSYPPYRFEIAENDKIEIHPISDQDGTAADLEGYLRVWGIRKLRPLVADGDRADLDDSLIVLFAAAEQLGGKGAKDGSIKTSLAQKRYSRLKGQQNKREGFRMFGVGEPKMPHKPMIHHYRPPISTES